MAKRRNPRRKRVRRKLTAHSEHAPLAALAPVIAEKEIFSPIHRHIEIPQKTVDYRPTDKLVFVVLGILAGAETVYDINHTLRVDEPLLRAFGYDGCADQSVIQRTLCASIADNVVHLEDALQQIWTQHNRCVALLKDAAQAQQIVTIDIDLSGHPTSKNAQGASKGYFSGKRNIYGRQLARVVFADTSEIVAEALYPGNTLSMEVFKQMVAKMEKRLCLETKAQRQLIRLRLDAGFGTDANINYALWRGYHILAKMFHGKRAKKLAKTVTEWVDAPTATQTAKNLPSTREAGWVTMPHRYGRTTRQLAIRTPNPKRKGNWCYRVLVSTDMQASMATILVDYDARGGVPESSFCQSNQGLAQRKRRKHKFVAQQMLTLLSQLAHNRVIWLKRWTTDALQRQVATETNAGSDSLVQPLELAIKTISGFGIKRFVRQILGLSGKVIIKGNRVKRLVLHRLYPMIDRIQTALGVLLTPYRVRVSVSKT